MPATTSMQWLFFDLGWTLIDEMPAFRVRADETARRLRARGIVVTGDAFIERCYACGCTDARSPYRSALRAFLGADVIAPEFIVDYDHATECLFAGVPELLAQFATRHRLGVIANQSSGTEQRLRAFGIRECFDVVLSSTEFGAAKPDPRIFAEAERRAACDACELVMIGDRIDNDIRPARARGWRTIRVRQGFSKDQESARDEDRPDSEVASLVDLPLALGAPVLPVGGAAGSAMTRVLGRDLDDEVRALLSLSVGNPGEEKLRTVWERYHAQAGHALWTVEQDSRRVGLIGIEDDSLTRRIIIRHIAVAPPFQRQGIGRRMVRRLMDLFPGRRLCAETDATAVEFYRRCGFAIRRLGEIYSGTGRFLCELAHVAEPHDVVAARSP